MKREWEICFDLCLESINSGSLGISALITDEEHTVIAKGRNQLFDDDDSGATRLINKDWYLTKKDFTITFASGEVENLFFILGTYSLLINRKLPLTHLYFNKIGKRYSKNLDRLLELSKNANFNMAIQDRDKTRIMELARDIDIN